MTATSTSTKSSLSPARRQLLELLQKLHFGRVEHLVVRGGEPVLDPAPRLVKEIKFGGDNAPHPAVNKNDFALKPQHRDLFALLTAVGDGTIAVLTVKHGLPFHAEADA
jgi:hypothetical protein